MAFCVGCLVGCVFIVVTLIQETFAGTTHIVRGSIGWTVSPSGFSYGTWAASQKFIVDDKLSFNFTTGVHDVAEFSKADYESCIKKNPISFVFGSPLELRIDTAGEHYFSCTVDKHCEKKQKLAITVLGSSSPTSPPASNSASSHTVGGVSLLLISTVMAFFY